MSLGNQLDSVTSKPGFWSLTYNVTLFVVACYMIYLVRQFPRLKVMFIIVIIGMFFINIMSIFQYRWARDRKLAMSAKQRANIVLSHCPDYWTKTLSKDAVTCENKFTSPQENGTTKEYKFGEKTAPASVNIAEIIRMKNQDKCWKFSRENVPWMELKMKCEAAGV